MEKQLCTYAIAGILREESDEDHAIRSSEIIEKLEQQYEMKIGRHKLYSTIQQLRMLGEDIVYDPHSKGYYMASRQLTKGEVFMLCNAIHASNFITREQSELLIDHLLKILKKHDRREYTDSVFKPNPKKMDNEDLMYNIEVASAAIRQRHKLSFDYMHYNKDKKLTICNHEPIIVEPRYICYVDGRPYLVIQGGRKEGYMHYRIDRMCNAKVTTEKCIIPYEQVDAYDYSDNKLFMFSGKMVTVTIRCRKRILDAMIDIFGTEHILFEPDEFHYQISVKVNDNGIIFLAQQYIDAIEIISPEDIRNRIRKILDAANY